MKCRKGRVYLTLYPLLAPRWCVTYLPTEVFWQYFDFFQPILFYFQGYRLTRQFKLELYGRSSAPLLTNQVTESSDLVHHDREPPKSSPAPYIPYLPAYVPTHSHILQDITTYIHYYVEGYLHTFIPMYICRC